MNIGTLYPIPYIGAIYTGLINGKEEPETIKLFSTEILDLRKELETKINLNVQLFPIFTMKADSSSGEILTTFAYKVIKVETIKNKIGF